jgi:formiminoglutamase
VASNFKYIIPPEVVRRSNRQDKYENRVSNWTRLWDGEEPFDAAFLGAPLGKAAQSGTSGAAGGPNAVREAFMANTTYSPDFDVDLQQLRVADLGDVVMHITDVLRCHRNIKEAVTEFYGRVGDKLLVLVGGDHSITCPVVEGYCLTHPGQRLGLIHFDAHNDVRSFEAGGPTNGTPIRGILEGPATVAGRNVVQLGIHGFMNSSYYKGYCQEQGMTVVSVREIRRRGIDEVVQQAVSLATSETHAVYVSVDIDVLSLAYAPGTGAASAEGLEPWDVLEAMFVLGQHPAVVGLDLVCLDPLRDFNNYTARTAAGIILTFLGGFLLRHTGGKGY